MSIVFPLVTSTILQAQQILQNQPQRVLLLGQKLSGGTAVPGSLVANIQNDGSENTLFGEGSMLAAMVRKFKAKNPVTRLDAIPLSDDGSAVASTRTITFATNAATAGTITFAIASMDYTFNINVIATNTPTQIAALLVAAVNAQPRCQFTAANTAGVVTLTAAQGGVEGNYLGVRLVSMGTVTGTTVTIANVGGGSNNPSLTGVFDVVDGERYQTVVIPSSYARSVDGNCYKFLKDFLESRWNVPFRIMDGIGIAAFVGTFSEAIMTGTALNSAFLNPWLVMPQSDSGIRYDHDIFEVPNLQAASTAAIRSLRLTAGSNLRQYVIGELSDQVGGMHIASLPYANTPYFDLPSIEVDELLSIEEIKELNDVGFSKLSNNKSNDLLISGQALTTFKRDPSGNPSLDYKYVNYVDTISNVREFQHNNIQDKYKQYRLTNGDIGDGNETNAADIAAYVKGLYLLLGEASLVVKGEAAMLDFDENLVVTIDLGTGTASISQVAAIVTQLRIILNTITFGFQTA